MSAYIGLRFEDIDTNADYHDSPAGMATPLFQTQPPDLAVSRRDGPSGSHEAPAGKVSACSSATSNVSGSHLLTGNGSHRPAKMSSSASAQNG